MQRKQALALAAWAAMGAVQLMAFKEGVDVWIELGWIVSASAFVVILTIPVPYLGSVAVTAVAFVGANLGWQLSWWQADLVLLPFAALSVIVMGAGGTLDSFVWRRRSREPADDADVDSTGVSTNTVARSLERCWKPMLEQKTVDAGPFADPIEAHERSHLAEKILRPLAELNVAEAQYRLGRIYASGDGVPKDDGEMIWWYRRSAEQGHARAQFALGGLFGGRARDAQDTEMAVKWIRLAAEQNHVKAQSKYARMCAGGLGVPLDKAKAAEFYQLAADQGEASAKFGLGGLYAKGEGVRQDLVQAYKWFNEAAEQGHRDAASARDAVAGKMSSDRLAEAKSAVANDDAEALEPESEQTVGAEPVATLEDAMAAFGRNKFATALNVLRRLGEGGEKDAQYGLGMMYADGLGIAVDEEIAAKWYRLAAEQGHSKAQHKLGQQLANGKGIALDTVEAVAWYRRAAEQGYPDAQCSLGLMHAMGMGVPAKNFEEAVKWFRLAAHQGEPEGQYNLALSHANGEGVPRAEAKALEWFQRAADQGHPQAQSDVAFMHVAGRRGSPDYAGGATWYQRAADQGHAGAKFSLGLIDALSRPAPRLFSQTDISQ